MSREMTLNVRVSGVLGDFVAANVADAGAYENVSEYIRHLIRRDMERADQDQIARLKAELALAFAAPDSSYVTLDADAFLARNRRRRTA